MKISPKYIYNYLIIKYIGYERKGITNYKDSWNRC